MASAEDLGTAAVTETLESFRQLAVLDLDVAGAVWMSDGVYDAWHDATNSLRSVDCGSFWLVHVLPLAGGAGGAPYGALYSPWLGGLFSFGMDQNAATVTSMALEFEANAVVTASDPTALARALMDSIRLGAAAFDGLGGAPTGTEIAKATRTELTSRAKKYASTLTSAYDNSRTGRAVESTLLDLAEGEFPGALSLLEDEAEPWIASLTPVWLSSSGGRTIVVLGSSYQPLNLAWIEFDDVAKAHVASVSLIKLFDRVVTRGGEET